MSTLPTILLLCGSVRAGSSNEVALRTAGAVAADAGVRTVLHTGLAGLPHFNPDDDTDPLPPPVAELRAAIGAAAAVLISAPEYAGTLPGAFKNLLDWTVGGTETSDKPVAWLSTAAPGRGAGAEATLRTVLTYTGCAVVDQACARIAVDRSALTPDGLVGDVGVRRQLVGVLRELAKAGGA